MALVRLIQVRTATLWATVFGYDSTPNSPEGSVFGGNFGGNF